MMEKERVQAWIDEAGVPLAPAIMGPDFLSLTASWIKNGYSFYSNGGIFLRGDLEGRVFDDLEDIACHLRLFESIRGRVPDDGVIERLIPADEEEPSARDLLEEARRANEDGDG